MYNFNWLLFVRVFLASAIRKPRMIELFDTLVSPVKNLHTSFLAFIVEIIYKLRFNSQIIYLEKRLNDQWDNVQRGIYIENLNNASRFYVYNKVELKTVYLYNKWKPTVNYVVGDRVTSDIYVWVCAVDNINVLPGINAVWTNTFKLRPYLLNLGEVLNQFDFIVWVPFNVVFDYNEMYATVLYYKLAGKRFAIQIY